MVKCIYVDTSVLLLAILHLFYHPWASHLQLLEREVYSVVSPPNTINQRFSSLCHRRRVAGLSMLCKVNTKFNHSLFSAAATRVRHTWAGPTVHPLEFEVSRCITSQFASFFLPAQVRMWNDLPCTVFDTGMLDGFKGALNSLFLPWVVFSSVFRGAGDCVVAKAIYKQLCFSHKGLCCWF